MLEVVHAPSMARLDQYAPHDAYRVAAVVTRGTIGSRPPGEPAWAPVPSPREAATAALLGFRDAYGADPQGVWAAPGRVNLIGEHVDYVDGLCLPLALPQRTYAALSTRADGRLRLRSAQRPDEPYDGTLDQVGPGTPTGWAAYAAGVGWSLRHDLHGIVAREVPGFDVFVDGQVPLGAGLASSAALECAVALGLDELTGWGLGGSDAGRATLAAACQRADHVVVGVPSGGLDQAASLRCIAGHALLLDNRDGSVEQVPLDLTGYGLTLLVIDTRVRHRHVDGQYAERRAACELAASALGVRSLREVEPSDLPAVLGALEPALRPRVRHVVTEIERVRHVVELLRAGRAGDIGPALDASHGSLRDDYEVSCDELDIAVGAARRAGALGARMTGGGFGGSVVALVPAARVSDVAAAVQQEFAAAAWPAPGLMIAVPSPGAARVR